MPGKISLVLVLVFALSIAGCRTVKNDGFGIYLLARDVPASELAQIGVGRLLLESGPILSADDIVSYAKSDHKIQLTPAAYARLQRIFPLPVQVNGIPFVVCVGKERIYSGAFWTPASSLSFDGVVIMQPWDDEETTIQITLGYPAPDVFRGNDPRADPRIMQALRQLGKLKP